jgi:hypothetical protein
MVEHKAALLVSAANEDYQFLGQVFCQQGWTSTLSFYYLPRREAEAFLPISSMACLRASVSA